MRIRTIKPEFFAHDALYDLEQETKLPVRLAFIGIWCCCDREGRFKWEPRRMKPSILPFDEVDFSRVLDALKSRGFIVQYAYENMLFGYVPSFKRHQIINNKERHSELPNPQGDDSRVLDACPTRDRDGKGEGKGKEGKGRDIAELPPVGGDVEKPIAPKPRNELFDTLARVTGSDPDALTKSEGGRIGTALAEIKKACPGLTVDELKRRARNYRSVMPPGSTITATALSANWSKCAQGDLMPQATQAESWRDSL